MRVAGTALFMAWLAIVGLAASGCGRKAPGPAECRDFARRVVAIQDPRLLERPRVRLRIDELTRSCLVTPYDRELLRCVELGAPARACMHDFEVRAARRERS